MVEEHISEGETDTSKDGNNDSGPPFWRELERYLATLEAISELAEILAPSVAALDRQQFDPLNKLLEHHMVDPEGSQRKDIAKSFADLLGSVADEIRNAISDPARTKDIKINIGGEGTATRQAIDQFITATGDAIDEPTVLKTLFEFMSRSTRVSVGRQALLMQSLLTTAVSGFEMLFAGVAGGYFRLHPGAMDSAAPEFSLSQLMEMSDLEEAIVRAVDRRVEDLLRQGLDGQVAWMRDTDRLGIDVRGSVADWEVVREIFERRHCIVHHGGLVSSQYIAKVRKTSLSKGDALPVDSQYLSLAIEELATVGVVVALSVWRKLRPMEAPVIVQTVVAHGFDLLTAGRWAPAQAMFQFAKELPAEERLRQVCVVNDWLCRKKRTGMDSIRTQIEKWDTTALQPEFQMARLALLDESEPALEVACTLIEKKDMPLQSLEEWPLLDEVRKLPSYEERLVSLKSALNSC